MSELRLEPRKRNTGHKELMEGRYVRLMHLGLRSRGKCTNKLTSGQARFARFPCLANLAAHAGGTLGTSDPRRASPGARGRPVRAARSLQPLRTRRPNITAGAVVAPPALGSLVPVQTFGSDGAFRSR